jgi:hypothetical protein
MEWSGMAVPKQCNEAASICKDCYPTSPCLKQKEKATPAAGPGQTIKTEVVDKPAITTTISFPITDEEAAKPAVRKSLTDGMAKSIGVANEKVKIGSINGKVATVTTTKTTTSTSTSTARRRDRGRGRRRLAGSEVEFIIIADSEGALVALKTKVVASAAAGSIVRYIQEAAETNGVLTAALKTMEPKVTIPPPTTTSAKVTVTTIVDKNDTTLNAAASLPASGSTASAICLAMIAILVA